MSDRVPTILAMGGGGFTCPQGDDALDDLVLDLSGAPVPRVLFLPTASGDAREHDLDVLLREAWESGVVLAGLSAGAMCWCAGGITLSAGAPEAVRGLGFVPCSLSVHRDSEPGRLPVFREAVASGTLPSGWAVDDGAALVVRGTSVARVVAARERAGAERVERRDAGALVTEEPAELLAGRPAAQADPALAELRAMRELRRGVRR